MPRPANPRPTPSSSPPRPPSSRPPSPRPPTPPSPPPPSDPLSGFDGTESERSVGRRTPPVEDYPPTIILKIQMTLDFIQMVKTSTLASQFEPEELADLLDPWEYESMPSDDPVLKLSLRNFILFMGASQAMYEGVQQNVRASFPDIEGLSYYQAECRARTLSGVITWEHHMCVKTCVGFTGPFANLENCPKCGEP